MKQFLLRMLRSYIIKKMNAKYFGSDLQNHVLQTLGLREKGLPKMENIPPPPPRKVYPVVFILIMIAGLSSGCRYFANYHISQKVETNMFDLWDSKSYLKTKVYHHGDLLKAWYDDVDSITDSTKAQRYREAEVFIEKCKILEK